MMRHGVVILLMLAHADEEGMATRLLIVVALTLFGCAQPELRGYYAPLESGFDQVNPAHVVASGGTEFRVRSQGSYLNTVAGERRRTFHLQLEITRARDGRVRIEQRELRLLLSEADGRPLGEFAPSEVWQARDRLTEALEVPAWRRHSYDLFFDLPPEPPIEPRLLRLRWRWLAGPEKGYGDCSFRRLADDDPRLPRKLAGAALKFGVLRGFYMPGWGELGSRRLRDDAEEERQHHLFHAPGGWWW